MKQLLSDIKAAYHFHKWTVWGVEWDDVFYLRRTCTKCGKMSYKRHPDQDYD